MNVGGEKLFLSWTQSMKYNLDVGGVQSKYGYMGKYTSLSG